MTHNFMMDTNMVSHIMKGRSPLARAKLASLRENQIACISVITEAELRFGVAKSKKPSAFQVLLDWFLSRVQVLPWGRDEAIAYGALRASQEAAGKTLQNMDMLIAAHAISVGATLVTADKAFNHVPDLSRVVNWATDL